MHIWTHLALLNKHHDTFPSAFDVSEVDKNQSNSNQTQRFIPTQSTTDGSPPENRSHGPHAAFMRFLCPPCDEKRHRETLLPEPSPNWLSKSRFPTVSKFTLEINNRIYVPGSLKMWLQINEHVLERNKRHGSRNSNTAAKMKSAETTFVDLLYSYI